MPEPRPVAIVTGASGGMGGEIVRDLASTHDVVAVGRNAAALERLAEQSGCRPLVADVTVPGEAARIAASVDRLDVLVHAAAVSKTLGVAAATEDEWMTQLSTNVVAPALLTSATLPLLRAVEGTVVFIGSGASTRPVPGSAVYTASKHALKAVADVLRIDEAEHRLRVVTISPGQTDTPMLRASFARAGAAYEPERYIRPASVAGVVRFVVDAPRDVQLTDVAVRPRVEISRL